MNRYHNVTQGDRAFPVEPYNALRRGGTGGTMEVHRDAV